MVNTQALESTKLMKNLKERESLFYPEILNVYRTVEPLLNHRIAQVFPTYTQHDANHSFRIMGYMVEIVGDLSVLNELEITFLIYSALLHDIGMAASQTELEEIKNGSLIYEKVNFTALLQMFNYDETLTLQDYIRRFHAKRSAEFIENNLKKNLIIPNMSNVSFAKEVGLICEAHTKDIKWIKENLVPQSWKGIYNFNLQYCALVLRLADILDFDSQRTPWKLYQAITPQGYSEGEWKQHFTISNQKKIIKKANGQKVIEFYGECNEPKIHRKILSYIEWINEEIDNVNELSSQFTDEYKLSFYHKVNNFITSQEYSIVDLKFQVNYEKMFKLLMGEELYGKKHLGLRELIQNSIDACLLRKEIYDSEKEDWDDAFKPRVTLILDEGNNSVIIKDNGIGMSYSVIKKYFLELGASYYNSDDYLLENFDYVPIGNYGIGFLASYMLSEHIKVKTKHYNNSFMFEVDIDKHDEYVCIRQKESTSFNGTEIILNYTEFFKVWEDSEELRAFLKKSFITDKVELLLFDKSTGITEKIVNALSISNVAMNKIDLSEYLDDIDVEVQHQFSNQEDIFVEYLEDLDYLGEPFVFDGESLYKLDDNHKKFPISQYMENNEIRVLSFMVIEDSEEVNRLTEYIEDDEESKEIYLRKFRPDIVSIISTNEILDYAPNGYVSVDEILEGLTFDDFSEFDYEHDNDYGTFYSNEVFKFYVYDKTMPLLPLVDNRKSIYSFQGKSQNELYIRNIWVKNMDFFVRDSILDYQIKTLKCNVINKKIKPNVARTSLNEKTEKMLQTSIYQALCLSTYDSLNNNTLKMVLLNFLYELQNHPDSYLKQEYKDKIRNKSL